VARKPSGRRETAAGGTPAPPATAPPALSSLDPWAEDDGRRASELLTVDVSGFEGPLDLLLALARTQKVDLAHISVLALAEQYIAFIGELRQMRLEVAADYLVMAAWLAYLKSRLLLPREEKQDEQLSAEEEAQRLMFRLQRLEAMRRAAAQLLTRRRLGRDVFPRGMPAEIRTLRESVFMADLYDLMKAYADQRRTTVAKRAHVVRRRVVWSIKDARQRLERLVGATPSGWVQLDLFLHQYLPGPELGRTALASSFGASLEMAREGLIDLRQDAPFAPLYMRRKDERPA
jgi:segregation and condensation protein A